MINQDFLDISYLLSGNDTQKLAYNAIKKSKVLSLLEDYNPILAGTIPISINIPNSDLDILCYANDLQKFEGKLKLLFQDKDGFKIWQRKPGSSNAVVANFVFQGFTFEVFGENVPTINQNAYKHMLIEHRFIKLFGEKLKNKVVSLKLKGMKTEPAFAECLGIQNDPYLELLSLSDKSDSEIIKLFYKKLSF